MKILVNPFSFLVLLFSFFFSENLNAQTLNAGDLMCVGFNSDGTDDLAFVALAEIPANTTIYLRDDEWTGTAFNTGESSTVWNTGSVVIPAGAIISFTNVNSAAPTVNYGTAVTSGNAGLAAGGDAVYVYLGSSADVPTKFLTAVMSNTPAGLMASLDGTGLVEGSTAVILTPANLDVAAYKGARTGSNRAGYITLINAIATNWDVQDASGDQDKDGIAPDVPFSLTPFAFGNVADNTPPSVLTAVLTSSTTARVAFSESVTKASAETIANYTFTPALTVSSVVYDDATKSAVITFGALTIGRRYSLSATSFVDVANNSQTTPSVFNNLFFNNYAGADLVISELMYNAGANADSLEFIEIYNKSTAPIAVGGLTFSAGVTGIFPEVNIPAKSAISIAQDSAAFARFYGVRAAGIWATDFLGNGGEPVAFKNSLGVTLDSVNYDDAAPWVLEPDGTGPSLEIINVETDNNVATNWRASKTATGKTFNNAAIFASPNVLPTVAALPEIALDLRTVSVSETTTTVSVAVSIKNPNGQASTIDVELNPNGNARATSDFNFTKQTLTFTGDTSAANRTKTATLTIINDTENEADEYIVLDLKTATNATIGANNQIVVFINDDDRKAPAKNNELSLKLVSSYLNGTTATGNSAEIVAYDKNSKRLFIANSVGKKLDIVDYSTPSVPKAIRSIDMTPRGGINSVAIQNGIIALALEGVDPQANGKVLFVDTAGVITDSVIVGAMPDMIGFSPDGKLIVTANEGEPNAAYTTDPEGSVSIIDISAGVRGIAQSKVTTIDFQSLNPLKATLKAAGIRLFGRFKGSNDSTTVAQDLEPEYVTFSTDSKTAYVTLQENNAVMVIDLVGKKIQTLGTTPLIIPLGSKDHSLPTNGLDASDQGTAVNLTNWKVKGLYMPDGITTYRVNNQDYLITANEGDAREYTGLTEETSLADVRLDPAKFPDSTLLRGNTQLGRLNITAQTADTDGDGDIDEIQTFGARSFTIWNASTGTLVWDSGDWLERITRDSSNFNASNGATATRKARSRSKGPEPESVTTATIGSRVYAFVALERIGGVIVFNVTNPTAPTFVAFENNRPADRGAEGIIYLDSTSSPNGKRLVLLANETSNTVSTFEVTPNFNTPTQDLATREEFTLYPNPTVDAIFLSRNMSGSVINLAGQTVLTFNNKTELNVSNLQTGVYFIQSQGFTPKKFVVKR